MWAVLQECGVTPQLKLVNVVAKKGSPEHLRYFERQRVVSEDVLRIAY